MLAYEYHLAAEAEYLDAVQYYSRIDSELGMAFVLAIEGAIERARQFPDAWPVVTGPLRRVRVRRFPYGIIYEIVEDRILIWAVAHFSRDPGFWQSRLA